MKFNLAQVFACTLVGCFSLSDSCENNRKLMFHFIISPFRSFQRRSSLHCLVCIRGIPHLSLLTAAGRLPTRATTGLATTGLATVVQQRTGNPLHLGMSSYFSAGGCRSAFASRDGLTTSGELETPLFIMVPLSNTDQGVA